MSMVEKELQILRKKFRAEKAKAGAARRPEKIRRLSNRIMAYQKLIRENRAA